jgi:hypothetical protein
MANCAVCGAETDMFTSGSPQCIECAERLDAATRRRDKVHQILKQAVVTAKQGSDIASAEFDAITGNSPSGLPHGDGVLRVQKASRAYTQARQDLQIAIRRLNAFAIDGTVPDDLDDPQYSRR